MRSNIPWRAKQRGKTKDPSKEERQTACNQIEQIRVPWRTGQGLVRAQNVAKDAADRRRHSEIMTSQSLPTSRHDSGQAISRSKLWRWEASRRRRRLVRGDVERDGR